MGWSASSSGKARQSLKGGGKPPGWYHLCSLGGREDFRVYFRSEDWETVQLPSDENEGSRVFG